MFFLVCFGEKEIENTIRVKRWILSIESYNQNNIHYYLKCKFGTFGAVFSFSVCNSNNTHRTPTKLYINGKLIKLSKWWFKSFGLITNAGIIIQTIYSTSRRQFGCQFQFQQFSSSFVSFSTICALIPCLGLLIVRVVNFLQAFEENSLFAAYKTALIES